MKLILTRHGETEENKNDICQGWLPGHLSSKGKLQAKLVAKRLKDVKIDFIYTSDLKRAFDTAKIIAKHHKTAKFVKEKALRERNCGDFEGKTHDQMDWKSLPGDILTNRPLNGESYEEVWKRLTKFYNFLLSHHKSDTVLLVGHGGSVLLLSGLIQNKTLKEAIKADSINNTSISEFEIDDKGRCKAICINCCSHL